MAKRRDIIPIPQYLTKNPNGKENGYVRITPSLVCSDAYRALTPLAVTMYIDMLIVARGHDKVIYTQTMAYESRGISKAGYSACVAQLTRTGFIRRMPRACYAPSCYQFDVRWRTFLRTDEQSTM